MNPPLKEQLTVWKKLRQQTAKKKKHRQKPQKSGSEH